MRYVVEHVLSSQSRNVLYSSFTTYSGRSLWSLVSGLEYIYGRALLAPHIRYFSCRDPFLDTVLQ